MESRLRLVIAEFRAIALGVLLLPGHSDGKQPVSYGRQIAPIFALHCYGCHGEANPSSGLQLSTYNGLRRGGSMGEDITPGEPDRSFLVKFIEGFRGPDQRMPLGSRPLTQDQIQLIRQWIAEGAKNDNAGTPCYRLSAAASFATGRPLHISCKVSAAADLFFSIRDGKNDLLHREEASVKDEQMEWTIHQEKTWPARVTVEVVIRYAAEAVRGELKIDGGDSRPIMTRKPIAGECLPD